MNQKVMSRLLTAGGILAAGLFSQGCRTTTAARQAATQPPTAPTTEAIHPTAGRSALSVLNVRVSAAAADKDAESVAPSVQNRVEGALAANGFAVIPSSPDVIVAMVVESELFDKAGSYHLYKGAVSTKVSRAYDGKIIGKTEVSVKAERKLGRNAGLKSLAAKLAEPTADWIGATCTPEQSGLAAHDITLKRPRMAEQSASQYVAAFVRAAKGLDGVVHCALVKQDYASREIVFRIVYFKDKFPGGILNRLATIQELNIEPEN